MRAQRWKRPRLVRPRTIRVKRLSALAARRVREELRELVAAGYDPDKRPRTRADCAAVPRPCPFVGCAHHLYLDVSVRTGAIRLNFPDLEPSEMADSCALDLAERGRLRLEDVGARLNVVRERVRVIELVALAKIKLVAPALAEHVDVGSAERRRLPVLAGSRQGW